MLMTANRQTTTTKDKASDSARHNNAKQNFYSVKCKRKKKEWTEYENERFQRHFPHY